LRWLGLGRRFRLGRLLRLSLRLGSRLLRLCFRLWSRPLLCFRLGGLGLGRLLLLRFRLGFALRLCRRLRLGGGRGLRIGLRLRLGGGRGLRIGLGLSLCRGCGLRIGLRRRFRRGFRLGRRRGFTLCRCRRLGFLYGARPDLSLFRCARLAFADASLFASAERLWRRHVFRRLDRFGRFLDLGARRLLQLRGIVGFNFHRIAHADGAADHPRLHAVTRMGSPTRAATMLGSIPD
jgi:hypothetical protein